LGNALKGGQAKSPEELSAKLAQHGVLVKYKRGTDNSISGATYQLEDHEPLSGLVLKIDGEYAKWTKVAAWLDHNRIVYEAKVEEQKAREITERNRQLQIERDRQLQIERDRQLQAQPVLEAEISERLTEFYAFVGVGGPRRQYHNSHIFSFVDEARKVDGLGMIANSLAKDFVNPDQAAKQFEKRIVDDYKKQSDKSTVIPYNFVREYRQNRDKQQSINREKKADSEAWQNICKQYDTFSPTRKELFEKLQEESLYSKGGIVLKQSSRLKL
jgi:hypothetical protein